MDRKFKLGDKVTVVEHLSLDAYQRPWLGHTGTVVEVFKHCHVVRVKFVDGGVERAFHEDKLRHADKDIVPPDEFYFVVKGQDGNGNAGIDYHAKKQHEGDYRISWFANGCPQDSMWDYSTVCGLVNRKAPGIRWEITREVEQVQDSPEKKPEFKPGDVVERINHGNGLKRAKIGDRGTVVACHQNSGLLTVATLHHPNEMWFTGNAKLVTEPTLQQLQDAVVSSYAKVTAAQKRVDETNAAYNEASRAWNDACTESRAAQKALDLELRKMAGMSTAELL